MRAQHGGTTRKVALVDSTSADELRQLLAAAFRLRSPVVGAVEEATGLIFPLSLLCRSTARLSGSYQLLLANEADWNHFARDSDDVQGESEALPLGGRHVSSGSTASSAAASSASAAAPNGSARHARGASSVSSGAPPATRLLSVSEDFRDDLQNWRRLQDSSVFRHFSLSELVSVFSTAARGGRIDRKGFETVFSKSVRERLGARVSEEDSLATRELAMRIFNLFDRDRNGEVDMREFVAGLTLVCRSSGDDKVRAAFSLFDRDGDGQITKQEMVEYLTAFFNVCFELDPGTRQRMQGHSPAEVAEATADLCFETADADRDGAISFTEFEAWYSSGTAGAFMPK